MTDFLFFYEHVNREVENDSLIIHELRKRGYTCELMPFDGPEYWWRCLLRRKAKVLVVPWLRTDTNICHYLHLAAKPYKIVDLQWEQVGFQAAFENDVWSLNAINTVHLCWGEKPQQRLVKMGVAIKDAPITGAVQQDFARCEFEDYYLTKKEIAERYRLDIRKKWILYVSSFSFANLSEQEVKNLVSTYGEYLYESIWLDINTQKATLEWISRFVNDHDCEFIYRPHPTEKTSPNVLKLVDSNSRFHVIGDYSIKQWAKIVDVVDLWISTSNAELYAMGVDFNYILNQ